MENVNLEFFEHQEKNLKSSKTFFEKKEPKDNLEIFFKVCHKTFAGLASSNKTNKTIRS